MPRIEFDTLKEAETCIRKEAAERPYTPYYTKNSEVVLLPNVSTRPVKYIYVRQAAREGVEELFESLNLTVYNVSRIEWNAEHAPER